MTGESYQVAVRAAGADVEAWSSVRLPFEPNSHHYRYRTIGKEGGWAHWAPSEALGSVRLRASREVFTASKTGRWWLAARQGSVLAHQRRAAVPDHFGLKITVTRPERWRGSLAGVLKPLVDGLIAALQAHDGPIDNTVLARAGKIDPSLRPDTLRALWHTGARQLYLRPGAVLCSSNQRMEVVMTGDKQPDEMSEAELAEYHWQHRDDDLGEEVEFKTAKPLGVTMSFRLPAEEADAIREAAAAAGTSLSEWIRWAAMRAARDTDIPPPRHAAISRARELLQQAEHELGNV